MMYSINDNIRNKVFQSNSIGHSIRYLENLSEKQRKIVLGLLLSDFLKVNIINFESHNNSEELSLFINYPIDFIISECNNNDQLLVYILKSAFHFYDASLVNKSIIMEDMEVHDLDKILTNINKFHVLDKFSYSFTYEPEDFKLYFMDYVKRGNNHIKKYSLVSEFLTDKILDLKTIDQDKYELYLLECIREYYKWNLYRKEKLNLEPNFDDDYNYLNKVKNASLQSMLSDEHSNYDFLTTVMLNYLYYTTTKSNFEKNTANDYLLEHTSEQLQKKLQIKRD